jgi:hypothetical protein
MVEKHKNENCKVNVHFLLHDSIMWFWIVSIDHCSTSHDEYKHDPIQIQLAHHEWPHSRPVVVDVPLDEGGTEVLHVRGQRKSFHKQVEVLVALRVHEDIIYFVLDRV